jgi:4a-hydroxytetrahydrobiopterin dehydratase
MTPTNWQHNHNYLEKTFNFKDFTEAFAFICKVALMAEKMDHHPEIHNIYNQVQLKLQTHSAGKIVTDKDYALAKVIDSL